jgi:hypothetical protein
LSKAKSHSPYKVSQIPIHKQNKDRKKKSQLSSVKKPIKNFKKLHKYKVCNYKLLSEHGTDLGIKNKRQSTQQCSGAHSKPTCPTAGIRTLGVAVGSSPGQVLKQLFRQQPPTTPLATAK